MAVTEKAVMSQKAATLQKVVTLQKVATIHSGCHADMLSLQQYFLLFVLQNREWFFLVN